MPAVTDEQVETVRGLVASIPAGRVSTYGDIADAAGLSSPRRASGRPAPHLSTRQLELLRAEGVLADDGRVNLAEVRYEF